MSGARPGRRARLRRKAGGPRVIGRPAVSAEVWRHYKAAVWARCGGKCEVPWCRRDLLAYGGLDPDHVLRASQGGTDHPANITALCRTCHNLRDAPYVRGRLCIAPSEVVTDSGAPFTYELRYHP